MFYTVAAVLLLTVCLAQAIAGFGIAWKNRRGNEKFSHRNVNARNMGFQLGVTFTMIIVFLGWTLIGGG